MLSTASGSAIITKEFADEKYAMKTTVPTIAPSATDTGTIGEIRITAEYIYAYVALNTWVRFKNDNLGF
jgi:hypothetical protein